MHKATTSADPLIEIISYIDIKDLKLVAVLTPEFAANTKVRIYSATRDNMVKPADILYRRNPKAKSSTFYRVITADSIPYPSPRCSVVCNTRPYQLFLRMEVVTTPGVVAEMNEELEAAIALPF